AFVLAVKVLAGERRRRLAARACGPRPAPLGSERIQDLGGGGWLEAGGGGWLPARRGTGWSSRGWSCCFLASTPPRAAPRSASVRRAPECRPATPAWVNRR